MQLQYSKQSCVTEQPLIQRWVMDTFQNCLSYLGKKKKKTSQNRNLYHKTTTSIFQATHIPAQCPCRAGAASSKWLWWLLGSLGPQVKWGKKSRREQLILEPRHVLAPAHKGTSWWSTPTSIQITNPVALEWQLPQGSQASRQTHSLNINNEYAANWISHILVSGEEGWLLYSKYSVAFNSRVKNQSTHQLCESRFPSP